MKSLAAFPATKLTKPPAMHNTSSTPTSMPRAVAPKIAILVTPDVAASVAYGFYDMFQGAKSYWSMLTTGVVEQSALEPMLVAREVGPITVANGLRIHATHALRDCAVPDVVCIPDLTIVPGEPLDQRYAVEIAWLRQCHDNGVTLATACSGAMVLAETGLLDGHQATTHWAYCDAMKARHPRIQVQSQRTLITAGAGHRFVMAGGGTSWLDLALYLIARLVSLESAMHVARVCLIDWHRDGQQPFARVAKTRQVDDATIGRCQTFIAENYASAAPVAAMAQLSALPERSFQRRFKLATGMTPLEYVHALRIEEAKHLLETTAMPIDAIANEVGYEDAAFFSRLFRRNVQLTPPQYRQRFSGLRTALAAQLT
jgi:transcriptional regulator GlxA family with amidase domain